MTVLDPKVLRHLLAVMRTGSIRGAAEFLGLAPSAVSRQIADLEYRLGVSLLERTSRGVVITEAGHLVAEHARRTFEDQDVLTEQLGQLKELRQGIVRICCDEGFVADLIEHGVAGFTEIYPAIRFQIDVAGTDRVLEAITQGDTDIGVAYNPTIDTGVRPLAIQRQPLCMVTSPDHPLTAREAVGLRDVVDSPMALLTVGHGIRQLIGRAAADAGLTLAPTMETPSIDVLRRFAAAGLGVTFLPRFAVAAELARGGVAVVELTDAVLVEASAHLMVRAGRRLPVSVERMAGYLAREMVAFHDVPMV